MTEVTGASDGASGPLTFTAYAARIGVSRPLVSRWVKEGRIYGAALAPDRRIWPEVADRQVAEAADPAQRAKRVLPGADVALPEFVAPAAADASYARERARKTAAEAERAELELRVRKRELVATSDVASVLTPYIRELRDSLIGVPRDHVIDPVQAADCEAAIVQALATFSERLTRFVQETGDNGAEGAG